MKHACLLVCVASVFFLCPGPGFGFSKDYFIWDRDKNWDAALAVDQALRTSKYCGDRDTTLPGPAALVNYRTVWICLGMFPTCDPLGAHPQEIATLSNYIAGNDSTSVYMEGGDAWYTDPWTSFHDYFHLETGGSSGSSDLSVVTGQPATFSEGMSFPYEGDNSFVDRLVVDGTSTSFYLFKNDYPEYGVMVAYDDGGSSYKTVASSCQFAGLADGADPGTKAALAESIMSFFKVPKPSYSRDLTVAGIQAPSRLSPPAEPLTPSCVVCNIGAQSARTFYAHMKITPGPYEESTFVSLLRPDSFVTLSFSPDWTPGDAGSAYEVLAWTGWAADERTGNDTAYGDVLAWDDSWCIHSEWCYNDSIIMDGYLDTLAEWSDATRRDISDILGRDGSPDPPGSAYIYVMNDSFNLYLGLDAFCDLQRNEDWDVWSSYFEDSFDRSWPLWPDSSEGGIFFRVRDFVWLQFEPLFSDTTCLPYWVSLFGREGDSAGHMQYEWKVLLGDTIAGFDTTGRHANLSADLGDTVGFWTGAGDPFLRTYARWPASSGKGFGSSEDMGMLVLHPGLERYVELEAVGIVSPPAYVLLGRQYPVTVTVRNNGNYSESFWVYAMIGDTVKHAYFDSVNVWGLPPRSSTTRGITLWTVGVPETTWTMCTWIAVPDSNPANNVFCQDVTVVRRRTYELELVDILSPPDSVFLNTDYPVRVRVANNGNMEESLVVYAVIGDTSAPAYFDSCRVQAVKPDSFYDAQLPSWHVTGSETTWAMCAWIAAADSDTANNEACKDVVALVGPAVEEPGGRRTPSVFWLGRPAPNPFAGATRFEYAVPRRSRVSITVFNAYGSEAAPLVDAYLEPGFYSAIWDGTDTQGARAPSGVYFCRMEADRSLLTRKMLLVR